MTCCYILFCIVYINCKNSLFCIILNRVITISVPKSLILVGIIQGRIHPGLSLFVSFVYLGNRVNSLLFVFYFFLPLSYLIPQSLILLIQSKLLILFTLFKDQELFLQFYPLFISNRCDGLLLYYFGRRICSFL